jgi:flagellar biosynthesis protein FlhG
MKNLRRGLKKIGQRLGAKNPLSRETSEQTPMPSVQAFEKELDEQKQRAHDNHDRYLKIYTKLQNYKKQIENKTEDVLKYGNEELMRKILPFIDNLERVIEHGHSEQNPNTKALIEGIQLAIQDVKRLSEKYGAVPEDSGGDPDDIESQNRNVRDGRKNSTVTNHEERNSVMDDFWDRTSNDAGVTKEGKNGIIAIGGAKGGVGKSVFACNLAVALASEGKRVTLVDLDLGGPNLHLYLGQRGLVRSLNDFLCNRELEFGSVVMPTTVENLSLVGGNNSLLGAANLRFDQKLKLIKALRDLETDLVVIDLGGDISFNVLDFYLQAALQIVVSSTEPASYLDAYNFIKAGLLRRLTRYNGPEFRNSHHNQLPHPVVAFLREATDWQGDQPLSTTSKLLDEVEEIDPGSRVKLEQVIQDYRPYLIFNIVRRGKQWQLIHDRVRETGEKMLGISIRQLDPIPEDESVQKSVRTLKPLLNLHRESSAAWAIIRIGQHVLHDLEEIQKQTSLGSDQTGVLKNRQTDFMVH